MRFPWQAPIQEHRAVLDWPDNYTDALVSIIINRASGQPTALPSAVGALEAASGLVARAFATAIPASASRAVLGALTPSWLGMVGRALIRRGEIVFYIDTSGGAVDLLPCQTHDVQGGPSPRSWEYRCTVSGPERTHSYNDVPAEGVIHFMYARDADRPWRGISPLQSANLTGRLASELDGGISR